jgi:hypothetical protein
LINSKTTQFRGTAEAAETIAASAIAHVVAVLGSAKTAPLWWPPQTGMQTKATVQQSLRTPLHSSAARCPAHRLVLRRVLHLVNATLRLQPVPQARGTGLCAHLSQNCLMVFPHLPP